MVLFYSTDIEDGIIRLSGDEHRHASKSLRAKVNDPISVIDGTGMIYKGRIVDIARNQTSVAIEKEVLSALHPKQIELVVAPTKSLDRMEWMVEKAVEIGVHSIHFVETFHSERRHLKLDRLQRIAISAMKQSKNVHLPKISDLVRFDDIIGQGWEDYQKLVAYVPEEDNEIGSVDHAKKIVLVIGPEGDFSEQELELLVKVGFEAVSLGRSVLRTETAAIVGLTALRLLGK